MKAQRSSLFRLRVKDRKKGRCGVCKAKTILIVRDASVGWLIGACCVEASLFAEKALTGNLPAIDPVRDALKTNKPLE